MAKVKEEVSGAEESESFASKARKYIMFKKQVDFAEKELKELKEGIFSVVDDEGETDASGNKFVQFDSPIEGIVSIQKQKRVSRKIDETLADQIIEEKGLQDSLYKMVRQVDEDALMAALYSGVLTEEDIDIMYPEKVIFALVLNKK